jgi:RimJ/RimL family protein N-acetyltransferase
MGEIFSTDRIRQLDGWAEQLADLVCIAWTGVDGKCYFPYRPLTTTKYWKSMVATAWSDGSMRSWILFHTGRIVAHVALVKKFDFWELGRWVALPDAPHGAVTMLSRRALDWAQNQQFRIQVECTQAHTSSQFICERLGLRFAGIGILTKMDGVTWDIIYFDNLKLSLFRARRGLLGNPQGRDLSCRPEDLGRLAEIEKIITTDRGGALPPRFFHTLPRLVEPIRHIIESNH